MAISSSILKMKKNPAEALAKLKGEAEKATKGGKKDARFWQPTFNKEKGVGTAVIRFLPALSDDALPWVQIYHRSFKGAGTQWYFENDLSTLGRKDDPVYDLTRRLYASGIKSDEEVAKKFKRKVKYIANIQVLKDSANPDAEGKVFLYEFGSQIFDIISAAREPKFEDQKPLEPFNPWFGAPLNIRIIGKELGKDIVPNYEKSEFGAVCAMADSDDEIIAICEKGYDLGEFIAPSQFKEPDELKRLMFEVLGPTVGSGIETVPGWGSGATRQTAQQDERRTSVTAPKRSAPVQQAPVEEEDEGFPPSGSDDEDLEAVMAEAKPAEKEKESAKPAASGDDDLAFMEHLMG